MKSVRPLAGKTKITVPRQVIHPIGREAHEYSGRPHLASLIDREDEGDLCLVRPCECQLSGASGLGIQMEHNACTQ